ncbi:MAG: hypothetical protein ABI375_03115 [Rudaea sp.]
MPCRWVPRQGANIGSATRAVLITLSAVARRHGISVRNPRAPQGLLDLANLCELDGLLGFQ